MDVAAVLAAFAGMLVGFYGLIKAMMNQSGADRDADRKERQEMIKAMNRMAESNRQIADETRKGNVEAKERNGHLGEQNERITELVLAHSKEAQGLVEVAAAKVTETLAKALKSLESQHVDTLHVNEATIKSEHVENQI